mmetsp:Transcript_34536/g.53649  ORF Transcript_34536/g.53649 Transcript_34536/m.53649 type:complete len:192 (+) Transcript_34536:92-667(+)
MVSFALANFQPSGELVSRMLGQAMYDLLHVGSALLFFLVGWFVISVLLRMDRKVAASGGGKSKVIDDDFTFAKEQEKEESAVETMTKDDVKAPSAALALLESYGVFGVSPGTWTIGACHEDAMETEDVLVEHDADRSVSVTTRTPRGMTLLEHYNVFGACPKSWKNGKSAYTFGDIMTSMTWESMSSMEAW